MYSKYVIFSLNIIKMYWYYILLCTIRNVESFSKSKFEVLCKVVVVVVVVVAAAVVVMVAVVQIAQQCAQIWI